MANHSQSASQEGSALETRPLWDNWEDLVTTSGFNDEEDR